jgi:lysophospholipase L1-like esterase
MGPLAAPADAAPLTLEAIDGRVGATDLLVTGRAGSTVTIVERVGEATEPVATVTLDGERRRVRRALPWRCDRRDRALEASAPGAEPESVEGATAAVRTPSCAGRLAVRVTPVFPRAGRPLAVLVRDRWRTGGLEGRVCVVARRGAQACRPLRLGAGRRARTVRVRARGPGLGTVKVVADGVPAIRRTVEFRRAGRPLRLLATGDSMIQVVDGFLKERLRPRGVAVQSDARISTGISKPFMLDWVALARRQALKRRPDITVVFLGANDGFSIGGAQCCSKTWVRGYARRVRRMMRSYERGGLSRVYWLTLPAPRGSNFARVFRGVNAALRLAAPALGGHGRLIDTGRVFTPGGRFRSQHRQPDGVHLDISGARIAAGLIERVLRRDGALP